MFFIRSLITNLKRSIFSPVFWLCVAISGGMCFFAVIYQNEKMDSVMVFQMIGDGKKLLNNTSFCAFEIFKKGGDGWFSTFAPVLTAFPFIPLFIDEKNDNMSKFLLPRQGRLCYNINAVLTTGIAGGLVVSIGYALYGLVVWLVFPSLLEYTPVQIMEYKQFFGFPENVGREVLLILCDRFLWGFYVSMPVVFMASFARNKYIITCVPFFYNYAMGILNQRLIEKAYSDVEHINEKWSRFLIYSDDRNLMLLHGMGEYSKGIFLVHLAAALIFAGGFLFICGRKVDCSE